jgi:hypothetical protein
MTPGQDTLPVSIQEPNQAGKPITKEKEGQLGEQRILAFDKRYFRGESVTWAEECVRQSKLGEHGPVTAIDTLGRDSQKGNATHFLLQEACG